MQRQSKKMWFTIFGLALGILIGIYIQPLISGDSIYEQLNKFKDVLFTVEKNYVDDVNTPELVESAIAGMLTKLDPHSVYIPAEQQRRVEEDFRGSFEGIGVEFDVIRDTITVVASISGGPSEALGIISGDKIVRIDGQNAVGMDRSDVPNKLRGKKGSKVNVSIIRPGGTEPLEFTITRDEIPLYTVDASFVDENGTGYMKINRFADPTYTEMVEHLEKLSSAGMKRLILDLRGNPGGYLERAVRMADEFIGGKQKIVYTESARNNDEEVFWSHNGQKYEEVPLIVLVSPGSASASEIMAGAIQDLDRGLIVGETTFGKGLVQKQFSLSDGSAFRLTVARYYTPSGRLIQRPYDNGLESYYALAGRDEGEEGANIDHNHDTKDTTRPTYKTLGGRIVIGGGGITPDYIVKPDTLHSKSGSWDIITKNVTWEYVEGYMATNGASLRSRYQKDFGSFLNGYEVTEGMFQDFLNLSRKKGIKIDDELIKADTPLLKNRIKSRIARSIWGDTEFYQVALQADKQYIKALTLFPEAQKNASRNK
ncbi:MAG: S41 family peptidase [Candidatus Kapaibacterium sp.]